MQLRRERVFVETESRRIVGTLQLPNEGYRSRTTDFLNANDRGFIALTDADVAPVHGGEATRHEFVAVSARHIVLLVELGTVEVLDDSSALSPKSWQTGSTPPPVPT
ncbi:MAG: hypothetical protein H0V26_06020 [Solirubrobacterales bacterium]|nr:hypothetical protein [Solirubrobacterales bacterium]